MYLHVLKVAAFEHCSEKQDWQPGQGRAMAQDRLLQSVLWHMNLPGSLNRQQALQTLESCRR